MSNKVLIIDNYDSFTWNLYQYFREIGATVEVRRHDSLRVCEIERLSPERLVISPGPGNPSNAGISSEVVCYFYRKIPILGVCLGHQVIAQFFGAKLKYAQEIKHGKLSMICHNGFGVFSGLRRYLNVVRYHSLSVDPNSVPKCLMITAWDVSHVTKYNEIMGIRHRDFAVEGIQFHPESLLSEQGYQMLINFMNY